MKKNPVIAVVGPTASGKTAFSIAIAKLLGGEIISADSMQVYKGMPIASAAPTAEEKQEVTHHLFEFLEPDVSFSVADYVAVAREKITEVASRGKLPIVVGGTGLYIDSLLLGIEFISDKKDLELTKRLNDELNEKGAAYLLDKLFEIDKQTASRLSVNDHRRIIRALEVYYATGITLSEQNKLSRQNESPYSVTWFGLNCADRDVLYDRINRRVDLMVENGLVAEAASASARGTAAQAIGHKELYPYLNGRCTLGTAIDSLKQATRRYAKRQITWFRRNDKINWLYFDTEDVMNKALEILKREGFL